MENGELTKDKMYDALINRDSQFEGVFIAAVKTTGIFCRPTCSAKKPKKENVEFFNNTQEAMAYGYRPCRICRPMDMKSALQPDYITGILFELEKYPHKRISDFNIRQQNLDPNKVRRWFRKNHGMTFQAYQRQLRINYAAGNIRTGETVTSAAFESGYESLSGFSYAFRKVLDTVPREGKERKIITVSRIVTPLGPMLAGAAEEGICLLEFTDRRMLESELKILTYSLKAVILPGKSKYIDDLDVQLKEYFLGTRKNFELPIMMIGSAFQTEAWRSLRDIPYGETRTYSQQAASVGRINAVRAIGKANGDNRISIIIPCHRVIGGNGNLTGYGGGIWRKQWLIEHEKKYSNIYAAEK